MDKKTLEFRNQTYEDNINNWNYYGLAYKGGTDFIVDSLGEQNSRESYENWKARVDEGINFNYCKSIVDLFNFYLTEKKTTRNLKTLEVDIQWQMFLKDADLHGIDYDEWINESEKLAAVYGTIGIFVDKPKTDMKNVAEEIANRVYPYCSAYILPHILDWKYEKDLVSGRPKLVYLKLKDNNGDYRIWTPTDWEVWTIKGIDGKEIDPKLIDNGTNLLNEIPFVWMTNIKNLTTPYLGESDLVDISRIVASICRNLSSGEEIIKFAGFPMMRKPMRRDGDDTQEDLTGAQAVQEFDPELPNSKPDWMETVIGEPVTAILNWVDRKVDEIFRIAHLSGVHGQRKSNNEVASGLALRYEFQQLTSVLSKKAENMCEAEREIIRYWLLWQKKGDLFKETEIKRTKNFSIDDLSVNLENLFKAMRATVSNVFKAEAQKHIVRLSLPDLADDLRKKVDAEIDANTGKEIEGNNDGDEKEDGVVDKNLSQDL